MILGAVSDPFFYVLSVPALFILGVSKGGFGGGLGAIAVPAMTLVVSPLFALGVLLPLLCVMDVVAASAWRRQWDRRLTYTLLAGGVVGTGLGALGLELISPPGIKAIIGVIAVYFSLAFFLRRWRPAAEAGLPGEAIAPKPSTAAGVFWGGVSGFTSFTANAGGPAANAWLLPLRLDKSVYQATTVMFYLFVNFLKLPAYAMLGLFSAQTLGTSLLLMPVALVGLIIGVRLHHRISVDLFYLLCFTFLLFTGLKLLFDSSVLFT